MSGRESLNAGRYRSVRRWVCNRAYWGCWWLRRGNLKHAWFSFREGTPF